MALRKKTSINGSFPTLWRGEAKMLPGGFKSVQAFAIGTILHVATLVQVFFDTMTAAVVKTALVVAGGTTTKVRVAKGHCFAVGDVVMKVGKTDASPSIQSIDTSNDGYDVLQLSAGIAGVTGDDILVEATAYTPAAGGSDAVPAAPKYTPTHVLGATKEFKEIGHDTLDIAYDCIVLRPGKCPVPSEWLTAAGCLKENHTIRFITQ